MVLENDIMMKKIIICFSATYLYVLDAYAAHYSKCKGHIINKFSAGNGTAFNETSKGSQKNGEIALQNLSISIKSSSRM